MNANELIAELSNRLNLPKKQVSSLIEDTVDIIINQLAESNIVSIHNFGTLEVKKKNERINVHPTTGKRVLIPPKLSVSYKPSPSLKDKIRKAES